MEKFDFKRIPEEYFKPAEKKGRTELVTYELLDCEDSGKIVTKSARVYLPYGYDDSDRLYNVLYLMHGAGDTYDRWLGTDENPNDFRPVLDNMIANGDIEPLIVVTPWVIEGNYWTVSLPEFHKEFETRVMPKVESKYRTYAGHCLTYADYKASRKHRAYAGFSLGSSVTWYAFIHNLDTVAYFMPMAGDCWAVEKMGGLVAPDATADLLAKVTKDFGFTQDDYRLYLGNGTLDVAFKTLTTQVEAMKKRTDAFTYTDTSYADGNFHYELIEGFEHEYRYMYEYFYNGAKYLFK